MDEAEYEMAIRKNSLLFDRSTITDVNERLTVLDQQIESAQILEHYEERQLMEEKLGLSGPRKITKP